MAKYGQKNIKSSITKKMGGKIPSMTKGTPKIPNPRIKKA